MLALAAVPPGLALLLLLARMRPLHAALLSLSSALLIALTVYSTPLARVLGGLAGIVPTCVEVVLILLGGILLNELMKAAGANARLAARLSAATREPARAVVLIALGVTPFIESVTGFGVGAVVTIPLLLQLNLPPARAAMAGLLGLVTVPWGSLAPGTLVAATFTGVDFRHLGITSALLSIPVYLVAGTAAVILGVGLRCAVRAIPELLTAVCVLAAGVWATNTAIAVPLAGVLGSMASLTVTLGLIRLREGPAVTDSGTQFWRALTPYLCLVGSLLAIRGLATLVTLPEGVSSPALWLLVTCGVTPLLLHISAAPGRQAVRAAVRRWWPVAATTTVFLVLGTVLTTTSMSAQLAQGAAGLGAGYLPVSPLLGALGGFLTGSNTGANAMFATGQAVAATSIGANPALVVATQNVSASLSIMANPARVALAASLVTDQDRAGIAKAVLRTVVLVDLVALAFLAGITTAIG